MHSFRRAAVRMLAAQPARQLATSRLSTFSIIPRQSSIPTFTRSFQSARILLAETSEKKDIPTEVVDELAEKLESSDIAKEENNLVEKAEQIASATTAAGQGPSKVQLFVKNIPHEFSSDELSVAFKSFGAIVNTTIATYPDGKSRGWALVEFADESGAEKAIEGMHDKELGGRRLWVAYHQEKAKTASPRQEVEQVNKIYISNLPFSVSEDYLREAFQKFGNVTDINIAKHPDGNPRGFAFVEFSDMSAIEAAIAEMNSTDMEGRRIVVQQAGPRKPRAPREGRFGQREGSFQPRRPNELPPTTSLYIGNMSFQMSDRDLNDTFRDIQKVLDVRVAIDRRTGQPRGFAHADFVDVEASQKAKAILEQKIIYGRQLRVGYAVPIAENRGAAE
ncbi:Nuclear localization sequence-binding protein [Acrodontium crateriforme]|uniref:Nuclear localization sequence-binding protein n=1 Tax=Acrodontium crateriforme TaxID=150365 RepID=A0AAQ3LXT7_9PEZI|nr:Nuclear localization sequence-binding protein [Acrodontium crateriforme]